MSKDKALIHDLSTSLSFGRLSLKGKVFWPMLLTKADDQGRGIAEPDALKWKVCPNVEEITIADIPDIISEMSDGRIGLLHLYEDSRGRKLYQIIRWWQPEIGSGSYLQWARASEYEAPDGWIDRVRIQPGRGKEQVAQNWDHPGGFATSIPAQPDAKPAQDEAGIPPLDEAGIPPMPIIQPNPTESNPTKGNPAPDGASMPDRDDGRSPPTPHQAMFGALLHVYRLDPKLITDKQRGRLNSEAKRLLDASRTPRDVWSAGEWWWEKDWRGKQGSTPTYGQLVETLGKVAETTGPAELGVYQ